MVSCPLQTAILRYEENGIVGDEDPADEVTYDNTRPAPDELGLNDETGVSSKNNIQIVDLKSLGSDKHDHDLLDRPDKKFYIAL
ncbi:hypothetical protein ElyMa_002106200, partial [Elysia marginata]